MSDSICKTCGGDRDRYGFDPQGCACSPSAAPEFRPPIGDQEWCQPGDIGKRQFLVTFDDPDCRNAVFDDEIEARRFWAKACLNWNCYLFGALPVAPSPEPKTAAARYQHLKGGTYEALGIAKMQTALWMEPGIYPAPGPVDMREVMVYRAEKDGSLWVRPIEEFNHRFTELNASTSPEPTLLRAAGDTGQQLIGSNNDERAPGWRSDHNSPVETQTQVPGGNMIGFDPQPLGCLPSLTEWGDDWTVSDTETAGKILQYLGVGQDASKEPGADLRRDIVAKMIRDQIEARSPESISKGGKLPYSRAVLEQALEYLANDAETDPDTIVEVAFALVGKTVPEEAPPSSRLAGRLATADDVNAAFDPANEAMGGAFAAGFREGWLYSEIDADGERYAEMSEEYALAVDGAPEEAWDAHRAKFFAMLPLAAIPEINAPIADVKGEINRVVQSVNEWDDRTSPDDYPECLLITSEELALILRNFAATLTTTEVSQ